tara:strand:+ start:2088 stop:2915 length:828 start_codon:yes stop_codon:yes gene_type:complete
MKISIVDIGSNAVKYKIFNSQNYELLEYYREPLRLGRDVFKDGSLSATTQEKLINLLNKYQNIFKENGIDDVKYIATSAVRDANNSDELLNKLENEGIDLKILTGKEEASLLLELNENIINSAVIDIGGGSVEVCINKDSKMYYESFQLGAVRLLNMNENEYKRSLSKFGDWLNKFKPIPITYGLGGNLRALMQANSVTGAIKVSELKSYINTYNKFDDRTLMEKFSIPKDRIDIVPLAAKIYLFFLLKLDANSIENSFFSISDGLVKKIVKEEL